MRKKENPKKEKSSARSATLRMEERRTNGEEEKISFFLGRRTCGFTEEEVGERVPEKVRYQS